MGREFQYLHLLRDTIYFLTFGDIVWLFLIVWIPPTPHLNLCECRRHICLSVSDKVNPDMSVNHICASRHNPLLILLQFQFPYLGSSLGSAHCYALSRFLYLPTIARPQEFGHELSEFLVFMNCYYQRTWFVNIPLKIPYWLSFGMLASKFLTLFELLWVTLGKQKM